MKRPPCMVWLPMDHRVLGDHEHKAPYLVLGDKYARTVKIRAQAHPVLFPLTDAQQMPELPSLVDGVMLTGSPSNVHLVPGRMNHREPNNVSVAQQYAPRHEVSLPTTQRSGNGRERTPCRSTPCTGKESVGWHKVCLRWVTRWTVWSRPLRSQVQVSLPMRCNGTGSGNAGKHLFMRQFSMPFGQACHARQSARLSGPDHALQLAVGSF